MLAMLLATESLGVLLSPPITVTSVKLELRLNAGLVSVLRSLSS
jgi:hypothetical protein